jgi:hypothetical protein
MTPMVVQSCLPQTYFLPDVIEFRGGFPGRIQFLSPAAALPDDQPVLEVRHELHILLFQMFLRLSFSATDARDK